ncbi:MAG: hypothetical protein MHPSP_001959, partial [Paramarteilia canceri]
DGNVLRLKVNYLPKDKQTSLNEQEKEIHTDQVIDYQNKKIKNDQKNSKSIENSLESKFNQLINSKSNGQNSSLLDNADNSNKLPIGADRNVILLKLFIFID